MSRCENNSVDIEKWLLLIRADGVGPTTFVRLVKHFGSIDSALGASAEQLTKIDRIGAKTAEAIVQSRETFDVSAELGLAEKLGVWIMNIEDDRYPPALRHIYDPPPVLYVKGTITRGDNLAFGIVGSRSCSTYGLEQASRFANLLANSGFTIVSGMARGIDTAAHRGALASGGRTIAVQGCGLAEVYPPESKDLFERISRNGAIISELPLSFVPESKNFPARNRIIAGLSMAVMVVEAAHRSGALITAQAALDNGREVMALPGRIDSPLTAGTHELLKQGAKLVTCVEDVMETLGFVGEGLKDHVLQTSQAVEGKTERTLFDVSDLSLSQNETSVYDCLGAEPLHIEDIIADSKLAVASINSSLISLRLKGLIKQLPGNMFKKN
ncbi:MAG: DNA-processing protein DprA [Sedimentisphaerales bacterium]|nr:DNA-processing protein DprA [Sedimentisphaerales bacterium]